MATRETIRQRQDNEFEVIQSIFGNDVEDLRPHGNTWKPLDLRISLAPLKDAAGDHEAYVKTKLRIICPNKYPKSIPKIELEETKGIADVNVAELKGMLQAQAAALKGEVMIFELAQTVQAFLHKHNKAPSGSLWHQMVTTQEQRKQDELNLQRIKENEERQTLIVEVQKRKETLKMENRRREPRRSMSESQTSKYRDTSSSESSDNATIQKRGHLYPNKCFEHRNSETLHFNRCGRKIIKGCCLGHSQKGCVAFSAIDTNTGQLLYLTEWNVRYCQIEEKCNGNCFWLNEPKCNGHKIDDFIVSIEKHVARLSHFHHKNLIQYECVHCVKKKEGLFIYLVQDFVLGTSVFSISGALGWCPEGVSMVAKGVLEALQFLHNEGVSHSNLCDTSVFMDNAGTIRCTNFSLVPNLHDLMDDNNSARCLKGDLPALGALIESLLPTLQPEMRDFVEKCKSDRTLSASDLLEHSFLRPSEIKKSVNIPNFPKVNPEKSLIAYHLQPSTAPIKESRLTHEFETLNWLGKGAYGDVLKVRNKLDNRQYAIKRIPLSARSRQLYRKMTREVELLSRLNHENVVRYFNSWIEETTETELEQMEQDFGDEFSISSESHKPSSKYQQRAIEAADPSSSSSWNNFIPRVADLDDSDEDDIQFVNSDGEVAAYSDQQYDENSSRETDIRRKTATPRPLQIMYIQMEFCEKHTLRTAIDENLYENTERLWRLFREIAEGLSHIHQQGMIHRDLKPVNIFLDSRDQIKIGDFGLATTSFLALQSHEQVIAASSAAIESGTGTGKVGTTLYVAPELTGSASKSTYNQKVDMYTLGIILFEMNNAPFDTGMERVKTIHALRNPTIEIPEKMLDDPKHKKTVEILRWLLNHDPSQRPTAEELLSSDLVPPAPLEASELQEMLRHALANPQSKAYKYLVARCLAQEGDAVLQLTYHYGLVPISRVLDFVKAKVVNIFKKHGAIEITTPLLTPYSNTPYINNSPVRLMTHSGSVVTLPSDLRANFAQHIAMTGINMIRRYSIDRIYREKKVHNFHPKQIFECGFDIITPNPGNLIVDAELLSIAHELTNEIAVLKQRNVCIRMNHTSLLKAILSHCSVPVNKYNELFGNVLDFSEGKLSRFQFQATLTAILQSSKTTVTTLMDLLLTDFPVNSKANVQGASLKALIRGKGDASSLAKGAIREIETIVSLAQNLGVTCPFNVLPGLPLGFDRAGTGGVVWQMLADIKSNSGQSVLAVGERYDSMLVDFQKKAQKSGISMSGAGFSISLEKLVTVCGSSIGRECKTIDVVICISGARPNMKEIACILRLLWSAGIRSGFVESNSLDEAQDLAKEMGAAHVILLSETGTLRVRSWDVDRFLEKFVNRRELVEYLQKLLMPEPSSVDSTLTQILQSPSSTNLSIRSTLPANHTFTNVRVRICTPEKPTANLRRRYENQATHQMMGTLTQFGRNVMINVIVVELPESVINAIVAAINPREIETQETDKEVTFVIDRFPKYKRYISNIIDEITETITENQNSSSLIVAIYSITNFHYRFIL